jgi:endonuclease YncB( thermonuclease family)
LRPGPTRGHYASMRILPFIVAAVMLPGWVWAADVAGPAMVIDGDTIEIGGERVRLNGIDAPEKRQSCSRADGRAYKCGAEATAALVDKIGAQRVECSRLGRDVYGRTIGRCSVGGDDVSRWMVQQGHAIAFRKYSMEYVKDEDVARIHSRGVWAGKFVAPSDYRHKRRVTEVGTSWLDPKPKKTRKRRNHREQTH